MTAVVAPPRKVSDRVRVASGTTPGRYRLWSLGAATVLLIAMVTATASAGRMKSATHQAETESGPVLVATQQLVSSLAAADAAATAAFLSGRDEDPEQRRLYEQALARASQQVEEIASLVGRDPDVRASLGRISVAITRYAGLVEAARASNRNATADASTYLVSAVRLADQLIQGDVQALTTDTQANLTADQNRRSRGVWIAVTALLAALAVLVLAQVMLLRTSRRIVNPPLALATLLVGVTLIWLVAANQLSGRHLDRARSRGYDSIVLTARLGSAGFGAKAAETLALITGDAGQRAQADADAANVQTLLVEAAASADSPREEAAVEDVDIRWQRYVATVAAQRGAPNAAAARAVAVGPANSTFNGFNFATQLVLSQNRDQFLDDLEEAAQTAARLPQGVLLLLLVALAAALWGFQIRINDYR
ncbi:MAG: hypothetical protein ACRD12_20585 [Acidimicrobiales bacterium]